MLTGNDIAVLLGFLAAAITLAGFSGIITAIDRTAAQVSSQVIAFRIRNLVVTAFYSAFLSLLPIMIDALEIIPATRWQFCAMAAAIVVAWSIFGALSDRMRMNRQTSRGLSHSLFAILQLIAYATIALNIAAVIGTVSAKGAYFFSLSHLLFVMLSLFYRMILIADEAARTKSVSSE